MGMFMRMIQIDNNVHMSSQLKFLLLMEIAWILSCVSKRNIPIVIQLFLIWLMLILLVVVGEMVCNLFLNYRNLFLFYSGCGAQEENLHRRSNLFQCLEDSYHQLNRKRDWKYPIPEVNLNKF
jgi:hypothetical protein